MAQNGQNYSYLYDGSGNVDALINASQQVAVAYRYDPFGNWHGQIGTLEQPYQFSTKRTDWDHWVVFYEGRPYLPAAGRWLTRDPLGEEGGLNLYAFVGNNPVNWVDPWGLDSIRIDEHVVGKDHFASLTDAALDALAYIYPRCMKNGYEYGGTIWRYQTGWAWKPKYVYGYSLIVTNDPPSSLLVRIPVHTNGYHIQNRPVDDVAEFHCHPCTESYCENFSDEGAYGDIPSSIKHGIPTFLVTGSGTRKMYDPSIREERYFPSIVNGNQ